MLASSADALRILMVLHLPPDRTLGGARVQIEVAEHLREQGHEVDLLTQDDVLSGSLPRPAPVDRLFPRRFAPRAVRRLRGLAGKYDVIDAQQGNLPVTKRDLRFDGLLVARSVGLTPLYHDFLRSRRRRWPDAYHGTLPGQVIRTVRERRDLRDALRSYAGADLLNVPNEDERAWLEARPAGRGKCVVLPYGLSDGRMREFSACAHSAAARLASPEISFIGYWSPRKGEHDVPALLSRAHAVDPSVRIRLLGTGDGVHGLPIDSADIVPSYTSDELPSLLASATVGVLPSYVEGFPFGVLEQLAAGVPVVAYDAPGARETLRHIDPSLLVRTGDARRLADRVLEVLALPVDEYARLSGACRTLASRYTWTSIARRTADIYRERLGALTTR